MIRCVYRRDVGGSEAFRMIFGDKHFQSSFNFVRQSLEVSTQQLCIDKTIGGVIIADNLLTLFAKRAQIQPNYSDLNLDLQPNLIEICRNFANIRLS